MRDLIMGLANQPFAMSERFLASLNSIAFAGDICLFVYDINIETVNALRSHGVIVINSRDLVRRERHLFNSRLFMYLDFVSRHIGQYDRVMLTDVRDVIFQSDPFALLGAAELIFARENVLIRDCPANTEWIKRNYSAGVYDNIKDFYVSCAGTTIGTTAGVLQYVKAMIDEMTVSSVIDTNVDQGIHNYVVHMKALSGAVLDVHDRMFATFHYIPEASLAVTDRGIEVNGWVPPVIHQWERRDITRAYVSSTERFRLRQTAEAREGASRLAAAPRLERRTEAIVCWSGHGQSDALPAFFQHIRETAYDGRITTLGESFSAAAVSAARSHDCQLLAVDARSARLSADIAAHLSFADFLQHLNADDILFVSGTGAIFIGNPFISKTIGVSLFSHGPQLRRESATTTRRLQLFGAQNAGALDRQIVSTEIIAGRHRDVCTFYAKVRAELAGKEHLLTEPGILEVVFNKLAYAEDPGLPVTVRPNGSVVYFPTVPSAMAIETEPVLRVGGAAPAILMARR